jgi:hypothetical protein
MLVIGAVDGVSPGLLARSREFLAAAAIPVPRATSGVGDAGE